MLVGTNRRTSPPCCTSIRAPDDCRVMPSAAATAAATGSSADVGGDGVEMSPSAAAAAATAVVAAPTMGTPPSMAVSPEVLRANEAAHRAAVKASEERWVNWSAPAAETAAVDPSVAAAAVRWRHISYPSPTHSTNEEGQILSPQWVHPFGVGDLARVSLDPVLSSAECAALIAEADANGWAWHVPPVGRYGTTAQRAATLLNVQELGIGYEWVMSTLLPRLLPAVAAAFPW